MTIKCGSIVYSCDNGLGILGKAFVDHGVITHPLVIRHGRLPEHEDWHPGAPRIGSLKAELNAIREFCRSVDVMLFLETPFEWSLIDHCRGVGVKTVLMPMYECLHQNVRQHLPDLFLCPSLLDYEVACGLLEVTPEPRELLALVSQATVEKGGHRIDFLPVPVEVPWRQRTEAKVFIHNAGNGSFADRNGTQVLLTALRHVKSSANFIIRSQNPIQGNGGLNTTLGGGKITYQTGQAIPYKQLWDEGDVFVFPERWNGLSLPLQEARAAGMLVMAGDRFPINTWLPDKVKCPDCFGEGSVVRGSNLAKVEVECRSCHGSGFCRALVPVDRTEKYRIGPPYPEVDAACYDPKTMAEMIDRWHGRDVTQISLDGKKWAEENSWSVLGPKYQELLERVVG